MIAFTVFAQDVESWKKHCSHLYNERKKSWANCKFMSFLESVGELRLQGNQMTETLKRNKSFQGEMRQEHWLNWSEASGKLKSRVQLRWLINWCSSAHRQ